ncbi:MAG: hypothetical protein KDA27_21115 [Candidatus Eisenbacteria bacterium]|uniref:Peptidase M56 domain-containing protein n=1 Tax=Eiseniibacteriota bacterium TaxID=2212470 RepID=A0A956NJQ4_UNCEI|nr:hypothetical protein [Candidatus Eisenbacteria bacterium]
MSTWTSRLLVLLLVVGGTIGTYRASLSWIRIRRYLGRRSPIVDGPAFEELRELCRLAGLRQSIRLTDMGSGSSPLALGVREICIPEHSFSSLPPGERRSALAHELAHLVRRDPLWFTALHVLESVFFFLPLHRLARREIQRSAEFLCDDWATVLTGSRLDLARCLAKVAEWRHDPAPVPAASMAGVSPLLARVKRLLEPERPTPRAGRPGLIAAVVAVAIAGPVFGPRFTSGGTAVAAVEGEDYGEEYVVRSSRSGVRAPSAKVVELAPSAKLVELAPSARVVELAPSAPVAVVPAPSGGPLVLDLLDEDSPLLVELIPSSPHAPMVLDEVALEELAALDIAELPGQMILDLSDAARTLDLTAIDPDFGEVLILPDGDLRDLQHGTMTVRVAGDDYDLTARIENDDLIEVELDGEEIPLDRCEFDGETLTILDEDLESEMYTTRVPVERLRGLGPELLELRTSRLPELRESLPEFRERLRALEQRKETSARDREERRQAIQEARDAYLRAREEARALSERSRDHALSQEDRERFRVDRERAIAEAKRATELEAQLRTEQQRFQSGLWESRARTDELRSDQLRVLAQQLRSQKRNLERQLEDLELRIQELETNDADAPSPDGGADPDGELAPGSYPDVPATLRYWEEPRK